MTYNGWTNYHTWHLYTCLTSYDDSREYFEARPERVKESVTSQFTVWLKGLKLQHQEAFQAFIQGGLTAEAKDINWWKVKEKSADLTAFEQLAVDLDLADQGDLLINSIPDWVEKREVRRSSSKLASFCERGLKLILQEIDWDEVTNALKGE